MLKKIPHTYTIIFSIILLCAVLSWIIPAGEYSRHTVEVNGTTRSVIVDNSYHAVESVPQTWQVFSALLQGFEKQAGIIAFLLIIGGAFQIMNNSRAIDVGIFSFLRFTQGLERHRFMKRIGVNNLVIAMIIFLFSMFGAVFGMSEETLAFVIIIVPLAISMGYDSITGLCMVYVAAHVGFAGAILNPFTIGIAQGLSGLPLFSGFEYRLFCWFLLTVILVACVLIYAARVKRNPTLSPMYRADEYWRNRRTESGEEVAYTIPVASYIVYGLILVSLIIFAVVYPVTTFSLGNASVTFYAVPVGTVLFALFGWLGLRKSFHFFILSILAFTVIFLVIGVMGHGWYLPEISAIFLAMGVLTGYADHITVKWPNDIYWKDRKICGMLIENDLSGQHLYCSVVGIGLNINQEIFRSDAPNPVSLTQITGKTYDREDVLVCFLRIFFNYYFLLLQEKMQLNILLECHV